MKLKIIEQHYVKVAELEPHECGGIGDDMFSELKLDHPEITHIKVVAMAQKPDKKEQPK